MPTFGKGEVGIEFKKKDETKKWTYTKGMRAEASMFKTTDWNLGFDTIKRKISRVLL